jgi:hypothetical protein
MMQADYGNVKQVTVRISDWSLWTEQMEALANLDPEARDRIIEAWRIEVRRKQLNLSVVTAEATMAAVLRYMYPKLSPMKAGADEYAEIMQGQKELTDAQSAGNHGSDEKDH